MKDYRVDKDREQQYITSVRLVKKGGKEVYEVEFADGQIFQNIEKNDDNIKKIISAQEKQAAAGVSNKGFFLNKRIQSGIATIGGGLGAGVVTSIISTGLTNLTATQPNPLVAPIAIGILAIAGTIPGAIHLVRNHAKVKELEKIEYRNDNKEDLDNIPLYPNALAGIDSEKRKMIKGSQNPFCITNIDRYTIDDLEEIVSNISREKAYKFKYEDTNEDSKAPQKNKK